LLFQVSIKIEIADFQEIARLLRAKCHAAIMSCYTAFNNAGGAVVKLQSGRILYFPRAVILATSIYADFPAGYYK
jgi:hypothetical protein